ncbi:MAG TPA: class I SAM-dependent methyltransferase [Stellaceae bacterium]|nr:class I SAM-dependent methyltransferase [Stellaceae bacterium]
MQASGDLGDSLSLVRWSSDPALEALFWVPERLGRDSAWWGHVPFARWLMAAARPRVVVELGTHHGVSYSAFCQAVLHEKLRTRCFAIDTWRGDEQTSAYGESVYDDFRGFNNTRYAAFSTLFRSTFDEALTRFEDGSIDLLHIDGFHSYEAVRHDFESWLPKLSGHGVVLFHDTNVHLPGYGVWRLWDEIKQAHPYFEFDHSCGLGVLAVGNAVPPVVAEICALNDAEGSALRNRFASIGEPWVVLNGEQQARQAAQAAASEWSAQLISLGEEHEATQMAHRSSEHQLDRVRAEHQAMLASLCWRITYPVRLVGPYVPASLRRLVRRSAKLVWWTGRLELLQKLRERRSVAADVDHGALSERGMLDRRLLGNAYRYLRQYGFSATSSHALEWLRVFYFPRLALHHTVTTNLPAPRPFGELSALRTFRIPRATQRRLTMVTDSLGRGSLFGGVGTALLLSATLARRLGAELRIVTELEPVNAGVVASLFRAHGVEWRDEIDFVFSDRMATERRAIDVGDDDLFLTTAWWSTWNTLQAVPAQQIICLLQEDERVFYPHGDLHLRATEMMRHPDLRFIVNSQLLWRHLQEQGFDNVREHGVYFEPAFPMTMFHSDERREDDTFQFMFYARPNRPRNLYLRGVEAINAALEQGILDPARWHFCFAGSQLDRPRLARGVTPTVLQNLPWHEYAAATRRTDLGLCLMYTPLPSYPPLDLAASGAVVVTNSYGSKRSLASYSANILCVDPSLPSLLDAIEKGAALAADRERRRRNYDAAGLQRTWQAAFAPVLDAITDGALSSNPAPDM